METNSNPIALHTWHLWRNGSGVARFAVHWETSTCFSTLYTVIFSDAMELLHGLASTMQEARL